MNKYQGIIATFVSGLFTLLYALPSAATIHLTFGVYASDKPSALVKKFKPVLNELELHLSRAQQQEVKIKMMVAPTYDKGIKLLLNGTFDFSRLGPVSYVTAKQKDKHIEILAMESKKGEKKFNGVVCVKKDSTIASINELSGKRFAFGNKSSTIGRYLAQSLLLTHNITAKDLKKYEYFARHDTVGTAVAFGQFDAGALKEDTYKSLVANGVPIRSLATFPNVTKPWVSRSGMPKELAMALKKILTAKENSGHNASIRKFSFVEGDDTDYDIIRNAIQNNEAFFE